MKRTVVSALCLLCAPLLSACSGFSMATSAITHTSRAIVDERKTGTILEDATIKANIIHRFIQTDVNDMLPSIGVDVHEGRVLLTGKVSEATLVAAIDLVWGVQGVREVIPELMINDHPNPASYAQDSIISGQVKARLLLEEHINSVNFTVVVVDRVVYMMGLAQNEAELRHSAEIARTTYGVVKVISHVRLVHNAYRSG